MVFASTFKQEPELGNTLTINGFIIHGDNAMVRIVRNYETAVEAQSTNYSEETQRNLIKPLHKWMPVMPGIMVGLKQILSELHIHKLDQSIAELSGGQRKVALAFALLDEPDLLILDEPTNHLDVEMIEWLEKYLSKSTMTLLMVTHDRYFLTVFVII